MTPIQIYNANVGHTHEAAVQAVWDSALAYAKTQLYAVKADVQAAVEVVEEVAPAVAPVAVKLGL